jgi:hypothetical protein
MPCLMLSTALEPAPRLLVRLSGACRIGLASLLAGVVVILWAFSLSRNLFDPMGYDQALYQYMVERMMAGQRLYVDIWDQNGPGIVAIHWLSTHLVGSSPVALRVFDAFWQVWTFAALVGLALRDGRGWSVGWLAAALYILSYYSMGYVHTAQREGFAVLPLLLMVHLVLAWPPVVHEPSRQQKPPGLFHRLHCTPAGLRSLRFFATGVLGLFVFTIKPPLGLAFGVIWLYTLGQAVSQRGRGVRALAPLAALSFGFFAAAVAATALLVHVSTWDAVWGILSRRDIPGYILGPSLIRNILPGVMAGAGCIALAAVMGFEARLSQGVTRPAWVVGIACMVFALLLSLRSWSEWRHVWMVFAGVWIPATGSILLCPWRDRSETWRLALLVLLGATGALVLQGQFFLYHLPPLLALAAYLAAVEISDRVHELPQTMQLRPVWIAVCAGCVTYLAVGQWWPTMSFVTSRPYVLSERSLADHYTSITKHKLSCPTYATTIKVAGRLRELTADDEPIANLFHDVRIYYFARRPPVCKLVSMHVAYQHLFADYMQAIRDRRPKVIVARIPESLRQSGDLASIEAAVFAEAEAFFGPPGRAIRELYHANELIGDVCLLRPRCADAHR